MRSTFLSLLIVAFVLTACNDAAENDVDMSKNDDEVVTPNTLSENEEKDGWKLLFNGSDKNSWHIFNGKTDGSAWVVDNGTLMLDPKEMQGWSTVGGGDMVTEEEYQDFHFKIDWKLDSAGNSGVMFYVKEDPRYEHTYYTGPEMQVLHNEGHPDGKIIKHRTADLYDLISSSPETVKPVGEWNTAEIISRNAKLQFILNDSTVLTTTMWDENWKNLISNSKFKDMADFGTYKSGRIALQDHGNKVWFRNIKIKRF